MRFRLNGSHAYHYGIAMKHIVPVVLLVGIAGACLPFVQFT